MKINTRGKTIDQQQLILIAEGLEGVKKVQAIGKRCIRVSGKSYEGARIFIENNAVFIVRDFSSSAGQRAFLFAVLMLGIVLPLIAYYIFWFPKIYRFSKSVYLQLQKSLG